MCLRKNAQENNSEIVMEQISVSVFDHGLKIHNVRPHMTLSDLWTWLDTSSGVPKPETLHVIPPEQWYVVYTYFAFLLRNCTARIHIMQSLGASSEDTSEREHIHVRDHPL